MLSTLCIYISATKLDKMSSTAVEGAKVASFTNVALVAIVIMMIALCLELPNSVRGPSDTEDKKEKKA